MNAPPTCLKCGEQVDDFTSVTTAVLPREGDVSVCAYCSHVALFTGNLMDLREATDEEFRELAKHPDVQKAVLITKIARALKEP